MGLRDKAILSVIWNTGFNLFRSLLQFLIMLVLVRLLEPEHYGQFNLANSIIGFLMVFSFQNFLEYTIQVRDDKAVHWQVHFTAGTIIQVIIFLITNGVAVALSFFEKYAVIAPLIHVLSLTFLLDGPCQFRSKMLERELDWKTKRLLHALGLIISAIVSIIMAVLGAGVYALVIPGMLVTLPFIYNLFVTLSWRPTWEWDKAKYLAAFHFGLSRLGSGFVRSLNLLLESALIIQYIGFAGLGLYGRAMGLGMMFCQQIALQLMYSIYPVLTKLEVGTAQYQRVSGVVLRVVGWSVIPIATAFAILAEPVVVVVYGNKWLEVIPLLPWAMFNLAAFALYHTLYMLLLAHDEQVFCFKLDIIGFLLNLLLLLLLLPYGLLAYLKGFFILRCLSIGMASSYLLYSGGVIWKNIFYALLPSLIATSLSAIVCHLIFMLLHIDYQVSFMSAFLYGILFFIMYLFGLRLLYANLILEVIEYLPKKQYLQKMLWLRSRS